MSIFRTPKLHIPKNKRVGIYDDYYVHPIVGKKLHSPDNATEWARALDRVDMQVHGTAESSQALLEKRAHKIAKVGEGALTIGLFTDKKDTPGSPDSMIGYIQPRFESVWRSSYMETMDKGVKHKEYTYPNLGDLVIDTTTMDWETELELRRNLLGAAITSLLGTKNVDKYVQPGILMTAPTTPEDSTDPAWRALGNYDKERYPFICRDESKQWQVTDGLRITT